MVGPEDALERLLRSGWSERVRRFRQTGRGVVLDEVPEALNELLNLKAVELERLLNAGGIRPPELRHPDGQRVNRVTADLVVQIFGGSLDGTSAPLPTTPEAALRRAAALDREVIRVESELNQVPEERRALLSITRERLTTERQQLVRIAPRLRRVPRPRGLKPFGLVFTAYIDAGKGNPLLSKGGGKPPRAGNLLGYSASAGAGFAISATDRATGKRTRDPYLTTSLKTGALSASHTLKRGETGFGASVTPAHFSVGYGPIAGRYVEFSPAMNVLPSLVLGERYIAIGKSVARWGGERRWWGTGLTFQLGIRGDPIQEVTGPLVERCFRLYDAIQRRRGAKGESSRRGHEHGAEHFGGEERRVAGCNRGTPEPPRRGDRSEAVFDGPGVHRTSSLTRTASGAAHPPSGLRGLGSLNTSARTPLHSSSRISRSPSECSTRSARHDPSGGSSCHPAPS